MNRLNCSCYKDSLNRSVLSLQISNLSSSDHNTTFNGVFLSLTHETMKQATLYIKVPVKFLDIKPVEKTIVASENTSISLNCTSSYSRPIPLIRWIVSDETNSTLQFKGVQKNLTNTNGFISAINTLNLETNRTFNGWTLYCAVHITDVQPEEVLSSFIKLNFTYPPESRLMINGYLSGGSYDVFDNETGTLNCTIIGGNPKPFLTWNKCFGNEKYIQWNNSQINTLTWRAKSHTDRNCTSMSIQKERNDSLPITVKILCSPRANPNIPYKMNITLTMKESPALRFPILAYPPPDSVIWQRFSISNWINISSSSKFNISRLDNTVSLTIYNLKDQDFGQYRLIITNDIGSYTQSFYVLKEAIMVESVNTSLTGIVVGLSFGGILLLFGLFMCIWLFRRLKLKEKQTDQLSNQTTMALGSFKRDINEVNEYEQINVDSTKTVSETNETDRVMNEVHKTGKGTENDSAIQYEKLDRFRNNSNQYSELSTRTDNTDESIIYTRPDESSTKLKKDNEKKYMLT